MKFDKTNLVLVTDEKQRLYFLGYHSTDGYVVLEKNSTTLVIDNRYFHAAQQLLEPKGIKVVLGADYTYLKERIDALKTNTVGIDFDVTTVSDCQKVEALGVKAVDVAAEIKECMLVKRQDELDNIAIACDIAEKSFNDILPLIKKGVTEREVANALEYNFKKYGASGTSFDTIVAFGKNAAVPHHETGDDKLNDDECVLIDFGCVYKGYCSDMTRTMFYGQPSKEFLDAYNVVLKANLKALDEIKEGMTGKQADAIARDVLRENGYDGYFTHSLGHGIGVNIHELPRLSPRSEDVLKNNMVFSDEPGVYFNDKFGIRIEDSCYMKDGKAVSFMKTTKDLILLPLK